MSAPPKDKGQSEQEPEELDDERDVATHDSSTNGLIRRYRKRRKTAGGQRP